MNIKSVLLPRDFAKKVIVYKVSPFNINHCVILIYRLKESDGTGFGLETFDYHTHCGRLSGFSLLKKVLMGI